jgi:hypothetical protein
MFLAFCSFHLVGGCLCDVHMLFDMNIDFLRLGRLLIRDLLLAFFDFWYNIEESLYPA